MHFLISHMYEGLISLLSKATVDRQLSGIRICRGAPTISHLIFVDYSIIFYKVDLQENQTIHNLLELYKRASWQQVNRAKTSITFSINALEDLQDSIMDSWVILRVTIILSILDYLFG